MLRLTLPYDTKNDRLVTVPVDGSTCAHRSKRRPDLRLVQPFTKKSIPIDLKVKRRFFHVKQGSAVQTRERARWTFAVRSVTQADHLEHPQSGGPERIGFPFPVYRRYHEETYLFPGRCGQGRQKGREGSTRDRGRPLGGFPPTGEGPGTPPGRRRSRGRRRHRGRRAYGCRGDGTPSRRPAPWEQSQTPWRTA